MVFLPAKIKVHSLTGRITLPLLMAAFLAVKRNRGAAGIDRVSIEMFEANLDENLRALLRDLKDGSFQPLPLRRKFIPKNETEFRPSRRVLRLPPWTQLPPGPSGSVVPPR